MNSEQLKKSNELVNPSCHLFEKPLNDDGEPVGWLKRCKECMESENDKI